MNVEKNKKLKFFCYALTSLKTRERNKIIFLDIYNTFTEKKIRKVKLLSPFISNLISITCFFFNFYLKTVSCVIKMYNQFNLFKQGQCKNIIDAILFLPSFIKPCLQFALSPQYFQDRSYLSILEESCLIHPLHFLRSLHSYSILSTCYFVS